MEIAWENIPAAWEQEMAALRVCTPLLFRRDEQDVADDSLPKRQKKTNSHNASEHNYMVSTDPYYNIVRQEKSLLSIMSIDSSTMSVLLFRQRWLS
jgi:hypothetical protein